LSVWIPITMVLKITECSTKYFYALVLISLCLNYSSTAQASRWSLGEAFQPILVSNKSLSGHVNDIANSPSGKGVLALTNHELIWMTKNHTKKLILPDSLKHKIAPYNLKFKKLRSSLYLFGLSGIYRIDWFGLKHRVTELYKGEVDGMTEYKGIVYFVDIQGLKKLPSDKSNKIATVLELKHTMHLTNSGANFFYSQYQKILSYNIETGKKLEIFKNAKWIAYKDVRVVGERLYILKNNSYLYCEVTSCNLKEVNLRDSLLSIKDSKGKAVLTGTGLYLVDGSSYKKKSSIHIRNFAGKDRNGSKAIITGYVDYDSSSEFISVSNSGIWHLDKNKPVTLYRDHIDFSGKAYWSRYNIEGDLEVFTSDGVQVISSGQVVSKRFAGKAVQDYTNASGNIYYVMTVNSLYEYKNEQQIRELNNYDIKGREKYHNVKLYSNSESKCIFEVTYLASAGCINKDEPLYTYPVKIVPDGMGYYTKNALKFVIPISENKVVFINGKYGVSLQNISKLHQAGKEIKSIPLKELTTIEQSWVRAVTSQDDVFYLLMTSGEVISITKNAQLKSNLVGVISDDSVCLAGYSEGFVGISSIGEISVYDHNLKIKTKLNEFNGLDIGNKLIINCDAYKNKFTFRLQEGIGELDLSKVTFMKDSNLPVISKLSVNGNRYEHSLKDVAFKSYENTIDIEYDVREFLGNSSGNYIVKLNDRPINHVAGLIQLTALESGNYDISIEDNVFKNRKTLYSFSILKPWYFTTYAFIGYFLVTLICFTVFYLLKARSTALANEKIKSKRNKELAQRLGHDIKKVVLSLMEASDELITLSENTQEHKIGKRINTIAELVSGITTNVTNYFSDVTEKRITLEPIHVKSMESELLELISPYIASNSGVKFKQIFDLSFPEWVLLDKYKVYQILVNLISNSFQFTSAGTIEVYWEYVNNNIHIKVVDTGIGIENERLDTIFEPYISSKESSSDVSGLGLSSVRDTVIILGGNISVSSTVGKGSEFSVKLPSSASDRIQPLDNESIEENRNLNIVILDDTIANHIISKHWLKSWIKSINAYTSSEKAIEHIKNNLSNIDVIICDYHLSIADQYSLGTQVAKKIRESKYSNKIILWSGTSSLGEKVIVDEQVIDTSIDKTNKKGLQEYIYKISEIKKHQQNKLTH
jgi:CheY-like chemotaxis protein